MRTEPVVDATETPTMYCRRCEYALVGLSEPRCPECGQPFDPADPRTFRRRSRQGWVRRLAWRAAKVLMPTALLAGAIWGLLYWGWRSEQTALAPFMAMGQATIVVRPLVPPWLKHLMGERLNFVLDRTTGVRLCGPELTDAHLKQLARLWWLEALDLSAEQAESRLGGGTATVLSAADASQGHCCCDSSSTDTRLTNPEDAHLGGLHEQDPEEPSSPLPCICDATLACLGQLRNLRMLCLENSQISDAGLRHLAGLTRLERLLLRNTPIGDEGLAALGGLRGLRWLDLSHTRISDAGLKFLQGLTRLEGLELINTRVGDAGMQHLRSVQGLRALYVGHTYVTAAGIALLKDLPLEVLDLSLTPTNDADLAALLPIKTLQWLDLHRTLVGDEGLDTLNGLPDLGFVSLQWTLVTTEGFSRFEPRSGHLQVAGPQPE